MMKVLVTRYNHQLCVAGADNGNKISVRNKKIRAAVGMM